MGFVVSLIIWMLTFLRMVIAILLASLGISTLLASIFRLLFEPSSADLLAILLWFVKPFIFGILLLVVAYWISKTLSQLQKGVIIVLVCVISIVLFILLVSGMSWFTSSLTNDISVIAAPVNILNDINNMSRSITGV